MKGFMFLDELIISVKSGRGGRGCESYLRRADRKMIPNGGDGGAGGDVILRADEHIGSLVALKSKRVFEAETGGFGQGSNKYGQHGKSLIVRVPCGTTVYDHSRNLLLRDLVLSGDEVIAVKGGRGGYGNHAGRPATFGEEGKRAELLLSLSIIADIFLIGLPNSGKTTLLKALTNARVEAADYPFATKQPCLGTYETSVKHFSLCELPAIYDHYAEGSGLGNTFLKHLKRARLIFFMIDETNPFAPDLKEGYDVLVRQVKTFNPDLLKVPRFVVINKIDLKGTKKKSRPKRLRVADPVFYVSALTGEGIKKLMTASVRILKRKSDAAGN